jgi:hypothetical protein
MDVIDTIDVLFEELTSEILGSRDCPEKLRDILKRTKRTMQYISVCNPKNAMYVLQSITPIDTYVDVDAIK